MSVRHANAPGGSPAITSARESLPAWALHRLDAHWSEVETAVGLFVAACLIGGRCLLSAHLIGRNQGCWILAALLAVMLTGIGLQTLVNRSRRGSAKAPEPQKAEIPLHRTPRPPLEWLQETSEPVPSAPVSTPVGGRLPAQISSLRGAVSWGLESERA